MIERINDEWVEVEGDTIRINDIFLISKVEDCSDPVNESYYISIQLKTHCRAYYFDRKADAEKFRWELVEIVMSGIEREDN